VKSLLPVNEWELAYLEIEMLSKEVEDSIYVQVIEVPP
jgi:hypothetical protein